jgi:hypothetical protein
MLRPDTIATEQEIALDPSAKKKSGELWRHLFRWHFVVLLAAIVFVGAVRWRLLDTPLERDEGEYAYAGQLLLQRIPPYQLAYTMKLPGTCVAYAAVLAVFGQTARGIHLGLLLVNTASIILLYTIAARLFGALAGTVAGASYALLSTHPDVTGFAAHATHFVVLAALGGIVLLLRAEETGRPVYFFWSGVAFGIAFLMKQPGILLWAHLRFSIWPFKVGRRTDANGRRGQRTWAFSCSRGRCRSRLHASSSIELGSSGTSGSGLFPTPASTPPSSPGTRGSRI